MIKEIIWNYFGELDMIKRTHLISNKAFQKFFNKRKTTIKSITKKSEKLK